MSAEAAAAPTRRPSPRPRPDTGPKLTVVPGAGSEVPTSGTSKGGTPEPITAGQSGSPDMVSENHFRTWAKRTYGSARAYWTPPSVYTDPPASLRELAAYAKTGPWTHQDRGLLRAAGVWHYRLFGYPYTVVSRYREWVFQRPLRLAAHVGLLKLSASTAPGIWVVDHIVYPVAHLAGRIFL